MTSIDANKTEHELAEIVMAAELRLLMKRHSWPPDGSHRAFLEQGLDRFFAALPDRIEWWSARRDEATERDTVGRHWFDQYLRALQAISNDVDELRRLPFETRALHVATLLTFGESPEVLEAALDDADAVAHMVIAVDRLQALIMVSEYGHDTFLPRRTAEVDLRSVVRTSVANLEPPQ